ncbi:MAG TPA: hypothetical protein VNH83_16710 [Bryobacteraceae bacterium]|nr:hypothetical protein [Bryobacteraceae bacterium]
MSTLIDPGPNGFDLSFVKLFARRHVKLADVRYRFVKQAVFRLAWDHGGTTFSTFEDAFALPDIQTGRLGRAMTRGAPIFENRTRSFTRGAGTSRKAGREEEQTLHKQEFD